MKKSKFVSFMTSLVMLFSITTIYPTSINAEDTSIEVTEQYNDDVMILNSDISRDNNRLSLSSSHSAYITEDGSLYMWGSNSDGQLGNGTKEQSLVPIKIMDNVISVSLGVYSAAITDDGSLYMWGDIFYGELGNGTNEGSLVPIKIMDNVVSVSSGGSHSAAITQDGSLYMWGSNSDGQLGNGTEKRASTPIKIMDNVVSVSLGRYHSAAITEDGSLYMWGSNSDGQLGNDSRYKGSTIPIKVMDNVVSVNLGSDQSAAITEDGSLYMWGRNYDGPLGHGTLKYRYSPTKVMDNVFSVSVGNLYSAAITEDGSLYMWGYNYYGRLGNGTTYQSSAPIKIMDNVVSVSLGSYQSAAITEDGSLYMWGQNDYGQLGNGTTEDSLLPIKVNIPAAKRQFDKYIDGNNFVHTNGQMKDGTYGGFYGVNKHYIPWNYVQSFLKYDSLLNILCSRNGDWNGSCHGIALTMALNYNNKINIPSLSKTGAKDYYSMELPYTNKDFLYTIEYYQIAQNIGDIGLDSRIAYTDNHFTIFGNLEYGSNSSLNPYSVENCLKAIVNATLNNNKAYVLSFGYFSKDENGEYYFLDPKDRKTKIYYQKDNGGWYYIYNGKKKYCYREHHGHSIIAHIGYYDEKADEYIVLLYDENYQCDKKMHISKDYQKFWFDTGNGDRIGNIGGLYEYRYIELTDPDTYCDAPPNDAAKVNQKQNKGLSLQTVNVLSNEPVDQVKISFPINSEFTISNTQGEYIKYNPEEIDSTIVVHDFKTVTNGENSEIILFLDYSDSFVLDNNGELISMTIYNDDVLLSLDNSDVKSATFNIKDNTMDFFGENYKVNSYIGSGNSVGDSDEGLVKISASANGNVSLSSENGNVTVNSGSVISDVSVSSLTIDETYSYTLVQDKELSIKVQDNGEIISNNLAKKGDINGDGELGIADLVRMQSWLLGRDVNGVTLGTGDLCSDGRIDVFDMVLLRRMLISSFE